LGMVSTAEEKRAKIKKKLSDQFKEIKIAETLQASI